MPSRSPYCSPSPALVSALQKAVQASSSDRVRRLCKTSPGAFQAILRGDYAPTAAVCDVSDYLVEEGYL